MNAIVTVIGKDKVGIIAATPGVCATASMAACTSPGASEPMVSVSA